MLKGNLNNFHKLWLIQLGYLMSSCPESRFGLPDLQEDIVGDEVNICWEY